MSSHLRFVELRGIEPLTPSSHGQAPTRRNVVQTSGRLRIGQVTGAVVETRTDCRQGATFTTSTRLSQKVGPLARSPRESLVSEFAPPDIGIRAPSTEWDGDGSRRNIVCDRGGQRMRPRSLYTEIGRLRRSLALVGVARVHLRRRTRFRIEHHRQVPVGAVDRVVPFEGEEPQRVRADRLGTWAGGRYSATGCSPAAARASLENAKVASDATAYASRGPTRTNPSAGVRRQCQSSGSGRRVGERQFHQLVIVEAEHFVVEAQPRCQQSGATSAFDFDSPTGSMAASFHER